MRRFISIALVLLPALVLSLAIAGGLRALVAKIGFAPREAKVEPEPERSPPPIPSATPSAVVIKSTPPTAPTGPCALSARVVVLVSDPIEPKHSMAVLAWPGATGFSRPMVREGSVVGGHRVAAITSSRVWLEERGRPCFLDGDERKAIASQPIVSTSKGIERVDDRHVRVDRTVRDALIEKGAVGLGAVRIVPDVVAGKVVGMRVLGIPEASPLAKMGVRVGDSISSINGFDITSPEGALEAFGRLRAAPSLELSLKRNGAPIVIQVEVL